MAPKARHDDNSPLYPWFSRRIGFNLIIASVFLFLSGTAFYLCYQHGESTREQALKEDRARANLLAVILREHFEKIVKTMESYATRPLLLQAVRNRDGEKAGTHLHSLTQNSPDIESVIIADKQGKAWVSYPHRPELYVKDLSRREWYRGISRNWKPYISDATLRVVAEKDVAIQIAVPVLDNGGEVLGILVNNQRTVELASIIRRVPLDEGSSVSVADTKGQMVYSSRYPFDKTIEPYPFYSVLAGKDTKKIHSAAVRDSTADGQKLYVSFAPVEGLSWTVFVGRDAGTIILSETWYYVQTGAIALLLFLIATFALVYLKRGIITQQLKDQVKSQKALAESEDRFRLVTKATNDVVWDWNLLTDRIWWGEGFQRLFGYEEAAELTAHSWYGRIHPDERESIIAGIHDTIDRRETAWSAEYRFLRADGSYVHILDRGFVIHDETGQPIRMVGAMIDITERKKREDEIRTLNAALEERVRIRTAELEEANKELEAFSYSVSHDLRAPLRAIDGYSQVLLEDWQERMDADGKRYLTLVREASQRMGQLIDDLLRLARVSRAQLKRETIDLSALAQTVVTHLSRMDRDRSVSLTIVPDMTTDGDPSLMRIALENLFQNSYKFTRDVPVPEITFGMTPDQQGVVYFIRDNGVGFDMAYSGKLFTPFQRLHGVAEFEGTGIGLATVERIIRKHGGSIWAESEPGKGATFFFTFPNTLSGA